MCKYAPDNHLSPAKLPAFLYLKGRIFYYRYKLPKQHTLGCPAKEIRISLRTAYQFQASRIAAQLHALTKESLEHWTMSGHTDFAENMGNDGRWITLPLVQASLPPIRTCTP